MWISDPLSFAVFTVHGFIKRIIWSTLTVALKVEVKGLLHSDIFCQWEFQFIK